MTPGLYLPGGSHRIPKSSKRGKPQCSRTFRASVYITFANVLLVRASHMTKLRLKGEETDSTS